MSGEYDDEPGRPSPDGGTAGPDPTPAEPVGPSVDGVPEPGATEPGASLAEQSRVARLLAEAGTQEPMPAEVAARLDAVLADLTAARPGAGTPAADDRPAGATTSPRRPTTPSDGTDGTSTDGTGGDELALRRRRRRWPRLLVAAAAVSVVGLGAGTLLDDLGTVASDSASSAGVAAQDAGSAQAESGGEESSPDGALRQQKAPAEERPEELAAGTVDSDSRALTTVGVPRLRSGSLAVDLQRAVDLSRPDPDGPRAAHPCVQPDLDPGDEWLAVRLDGAPAVLVLRAPEGGRRTAEVFDCSDADTPVVSRGVDAR